MRRVFFFVWIPVAVLCAMPAASVTAQTQAAAPAPQSVRPARCYCRTSRLD
jgi:hypothetical protein